MKNEEGVVMMFILNFDYILDEGSSDSLERLNHTSPSKAEQREFLTLISLHTEHPVRDFRYANAPFPCIDTFR